MKYIFSLLLLIISVFPVIAQGNNKVAESEIMVKMASLRSSILNSDSVALSDLLSEDVTYGHSNGLNQTKAEFIRSLVSGEQRYKKMDIRTMRIRIFGDAAIVNMESDFSLIMEGKPMDLDMDILLVWVKKEGNWKLMARQSVKNI